MALQSGRDRCRSGADTLKLAFVVVAGVGLDQFKNAYLDCAQLPAPIELFLGGQILRDRDPDLRQHRSPDRQSAKISGDDLTLRLVQLFVEGQQFHDISADVQTDFTPPIVPKE